MTTQRLAPVAPSMRIGVVAISVWLLALVVANRWGEALLDRGIRLRILAPPLIGRFQFGPDHGFDGLVVLPFVVAIMLVWLGPRVAARLPWRHLLAASAAAAGVWAVALALVSGWYWLQRPMELPGAYLLDVSLVDNPLTFLSHFNDQIDQYGVHARAHPPGFILLLWSLDWLGLRGSGWAAALVIAVACSAVPAVLLATREVAGEATARLVAPFLVLSPLALYIATTPDALFAGVGAWGVALTVLATGRTGRTADALALAGGIAFGVTIMFSYGLTLLGAVPLVVAVARRRWRPVVVAALGAAAVLGVFALAGFSWFAGLFVARQEYLQSVARVRPYRYFVIANLATFGLVIGPAVIAGVAALRQRSVWLLVSGALLAVAVANFSGMSKGEVERIWLPFAFWTIPAVAGIALSERNHVRFWLALQASVALAVQLGVRTHW